MHTSESSERRRARRVRADLPLKLTGAEARLEDISTVGLLCSSPRPIPEMTVVRIGVELDTTLHEWDGAVVRCEQEADEWKVAVFFTDMPDASRAQLGSYIDGIS
ncbi:MAG: PilZ domain-containing protein [Planctomycetota bacterium]|nr:PilZ domain-containing protein [Planctomycetota bacterium]